MGRIVNEHWVTRLKRRSLWTPRNDAALLCWLKFTDLSTVSVAAGYGAVADRSGHGKSAQQLEANRRPALVWDPVIAGYVAQFDGVDDYLTTPAVMGATYDIYFLARGEGVAGQYAPNNNSDRQAITTDSVTYTSSGSGQVGDVFLDWVGWQYDREWHVHSQTKSGPSYALYRDGVDGPTSNSFPSGAPTQTSFRIGGIPGALFGAAAFAEIAIYATEPSPRERDVRTGYLMWAGGIAAKLSAAHPYRDRPPLLGE